MLAQSFLSLLCSCTLDTILVCSCSLLGDSARRVPRATRPLEENEDTDYTNILHDDTKLRPCI